MAACRARPRDVCLAAALLLAGCKSLPFSADPTVPGGSHVSPERLWDVEWWTPLVAPTLLEFQPRETASPAIDSDTGRIIVCTRDGFLRSLSPDKGLIEWERKLGRPLLRRGQGPRRRALPARRRGQPARAQGAY